MLQLRGGAIIAETFSRRAKDIRDESSLARRRMLADSLLVDLAEAVKREEARATSAEELAELRAELGLLTSAAARGLCGRIDAELSSAGATVAATLIKEAGAMIAAERRERTVASRRMAVLEGLASLGYEVVEGMATAWVRDGKVVLRRAATPGYGVEIVGGAQADRIQLRAVGLGAGDAKQNRNVEEIWCAEFDRLRRGVAASGGEIKLERAMAAGATPVKMIDGYEDYLARVERAAPRTSQRSV